MNKYHNLPNLKIEIQDQYQYQDQDEDEEQENLKLSIERLSKQLIELQSSNNSSYNSSPCYFTSKTANNPYQQFEKANIQTDLNLQLFGQATSPQAKIKQTSVPQIIQETNNQIYIMQKSIDNLEIKYTGIQKELIEQKKLINFLVKEQEKEVKFKNDKCIANVLFEEEKIQAKQSNKDIRISYFNTPFKKNKEINENNIKLCVQDIESGMNKSYKKEYKFVLIKTDSENVFIIAKNDNNINNFNIDINEYFSSIDIKHVEDHIYYTIKDTLPSIVPKLFFERPLGMKMTVCYIDSTTKFHSNYSFVRLFVSNQDIKCDYNI